MGHLGVVWEVVQYSTLLRTGLHVAWYISGPLPSNASSPLPTTILMTRFQNRPQGETHHSRAGFLSLSTCPTLGQGILCCGELSCAPGDAEQHPWSLPAPCQCPPLVVIIKNDSRHRQMSPAGYHCPRLRITTLKSLPAPKICH